MSDTLAHKIRKLARDNPALRADLLPLLQTRKIAKGNHKKDFKYAADEIENALQMLEDVVMVLDHRGGGPSLADDFREVADLVNYLRECSAVLDRHQKAMEKLAR